VFLTGV
jgi:GDP-mannose transporter